MKNMKILLAIYILVVLVQIFVPAKMIFDREEILDKGKEFKFKVAPIDPSDPFRGKYINLNYEANKVGIKKSNEWAIGEQIFVILIEDSIGFAKVQSVARVKPESEANYVTAKVSYTLSDDDNNDTLIISYPFDRFYMKESKAYKAELKYRQSLQDTNLVTYTSVFVKNGEAVLKDVLINGISIKNIVKED
jgi:uncharacterized membrane-anchored protein